MNWPTSRPRPRARQAKPPDQINNPMEIISEGRVILVIDWVVWLDAWRVVISDPGTL